MKWICSWVLSPLRNYYQYYFYIELQQNSWQSSRELFELLWPSVIFISIELLCISQIWLWFCFMRRRSVNSYALSYSFLYSSSIVLLYIYDKLSLSSIKWTNELMNHGQRKINLILSQLNPIFNLQLFCCKFLYDNSQRILLDGHGTHL